jgi:hypothetical protein
MTIVDLPSSGVPSGLPGRELPGVLPIGVSIPISLGGLCTPLENQPRSSETYVLTYFFRPFLQALPGPGTS